MKDKVRTEKNRTHYEGAISLFIFYLSSFSLVAILTITPLMSEASSQDIAGLLKDHLKEKYPWADVKIDNPVVDNPIPQEVPVRVTVEKGPPGKTLFSLEFRDGKRVAVSADVKAFDQVVMTKRPFGKGYFLQEDDVYTTLVDITKIPKDALKDPRSVIGKQLTRSTVTNIAVTAAMVSDMPSVKKGQKVTLVVEGEGFSITAKGEMRENGRVGAPVKVINLASKKTVTGVLLDEHTVRVDF